MLKRGNDSSIKIYREGLIWVDSVGIQGYEPILNTNLPPLYGACDVEGAVYYYYKEKQGTSWSWKGYKCMNAIVEANEVWKGGDLVHKRTIYTFNSQGGTSVSSQTRTWGVENVLEPTPPTRANYKFKGWFTASSGGTQITFPFLAGNVDTTYHAQWEVEMRKLATPTVTRYPTSGYNIRVKNNDTATINYVVWSKVGIFDTPAIPSTVANRQLVSGATSSTIVLSPSGQGIVTVLVREDGYLDSDVVELTML